jgi:hypothetical protein
MTADSQKEPYGNRRTTPQKLQSRNNGVHFGGLKQTQQCNRTSMQDCARLLLPPGCTSKACHQVGPKKRTELIHQVLLIVICHNRPVRGMLRCTKLEGYVHNMAQSTNRMQQLTRSKQTTERDAKLDLCDQTCISFYSKCSR